MLHSEYGKISRLNIVVGFRKKEVMKLQTQNFRELEKENCAGKRVVGEMGDRDSVVRMMEHRGRGATSLVVVERVKSQVRKRLRKQDRR